MSRAAAWAALHLAVLLFGFAGLFGKWPVLSPFLIVFARTSIAAAALGLLRLAQPPSPCGSTGRWSAVARCWLCIG